MIFLLDRSISTKSKNEPKNTDFGLRKVMPYFVSRILLIRWKHPTAPRISLACFLLGKSSLLLILKTTTFHIKHYCKIFNITNWSGQHKKAEGAWHTQCHRIPDTGHDRVFVSPDAAPGNATNPRKPEHSNEQKEKEGVYGNARSNPWRGARSGLSRVMRAANVTATRNIAAVLLHWASRSHSFPLSSLVQQLQLPWQTLGYWSSKSSLNTRSKFRCRN